MQIVWPLPLSPLFQPIALSSLVWNLYGAADFLMVQMRLPFYIGRLPPDMMPWIDRLPVWAIMLWALGAGLGLAGSALLLLRSRHAVAALVIALACLSANLGWQHLFSHMPVSLRTPAAEALAVFTLAIASLLAWHAWRCRRFGWLR